MADSCHIRRTCVDSNSWHSARAMKPRSKAGRQKHKRRKSQATILQLHRRLVPRTAKQYFAMSRRSQETWDLIVQIPAKMRSENASLRKASRDLGLEPKQVLRLAGSAFRKLRNGRYAVRGTDRLLRILVVPSEKGLIEIPINDSREASLVGEYWNAVDRYLRTGDASRLHALRKKRVKNSAGKAVRFLTDPRKLERQASAGVLRFESLYGRTA